MNEKFVSRISAELLEIESAGLSKKERIISSEQGAEIIVGGKTVINLCANNYLGLSSHPTIIEAAKKYIESVGGKLHGFWYAFGSYDGYNLWEAPDNVSMAAVAIAIGGGGALSKIETTPLLTVEETLDALRRAQKVGYRTPGTK